MSIERGLYSPLEPVEQLEPEYTSFPEPVYSLPPETGWESNLVTLEPYVPPTPDIQPLQAPLREIVNQTNITEVTQVVETIYQEADFDPLPQMEFQAAAPETHGTMGYFAVLLSLLLFGLAPTQDEML